MAVVTSTAATKSEASPTGPPPSEALKRYRRALDALNKGDWRTFGAEMDALHKTLEGAAAPAS